MSGTICTSITESEIANYKAQLNRLANLQLLDIVENNEKSDTAFNDWMFAKYIEQSALDSYKENHFIPKDVSYDFSQFIQFIEEREKLLTIKIKTAFPSDFDKLVERYVLQDKLS